MMSRSYRKTPIIGNCSHSDKWWKREARKSLRCQQRTQAVRHVDPDAMQLPQLREISDVYCFAKDGKQFGEPERTAYEDREFFLIYVRK